MMNLNTVSDDPKCSDLLYSVVVVENITLKKLIFQASTMPKSIIVFKTVIVIVVNAKNHSFLTM